MIISLILYEEEMDSDDWYADKTYEVFLSLFYWVFRIL